MKEGGNPAQSVLSTCTGLHHEMYKYLQLTTIFLRLDKYGIFYRGASKKDLL
jgi:hypothetical protein